MGYWKGKGKNIPCGNEKQQGKKLRHLGTKQGNGMGYWKAKGKNIPYGNEKQQGIKLRHTKGKLRWNGK